MDRVVRRQAAFVVAYGALFALGRATRVDDGFALWWPAAGVAMLWGLTARGRADLVLGTLLLTATATVGDLLTGMTLLPGVVFAVANGALAPGAAATAGLLRRLTATWPDGLRLTAPAHLGALVVVVVGAVVTSLPAVLTGMVVVDAPVGDSLAGWAMRHGVGGFVVLALVLTYLEARRVHGPAGRDQRVPLGEGAALLVVTAAVVLVVFARDQTTPVGFLVVALAVWSGTRLPPLWATAHGVLTGAAVGAAYGVGAGGPLLVFDDPARTAMVLQGLTGLTVLVALILALGVQEKDALLDSLRRTEERARTRADLLDAVTDHLVAGLLVVDARRRVQVVNDDARTLLDVEVGATVDETVMGLSHLDGTPLDPADGVLQRAMAGERVAGVDLRHVHPVTGEHRVLALGSSPVEDPEGGGRLVVLVLRDVTSRHQRLRQLEGFAGTVAHDLQNPLVAAAGWSQVAAEQLAAEDADVRARLAPALGRTGTAVGRAQALVSDLLAYTTASTALLRVEPVDLDALLAELVTEVRMRYPDRDVVVEHPPLGVVHADGGLLSQLLGNLLGNAAKYVAPGVRPRVELDLERTATVLRLTVADNGTGIPDPEKLHVFDAFHRVHHDTTGTGLGLAICAHVAERHGGSITVRDRQPGPGSVFTVTLSASLPVSHPASGRSVTPA